MPATSARAAANPLSAALGAALLRRALAAAAYDSLQEQVFSALKTDRDLPFRSPISLGLSTAKPD